MKQRMNRRKISQLQMDRNEREFQRNKQKAYRCTTCSKAVHQEDIITANSFRILDLGGEVKYLLGYYFSCTEGLIQPFYDSGPFCACRRGDDKSPGSCQTCKYGQAYIVQILNGIPKVGRAKKWAKPPKDGCTVLRTIYRCTNLIRMEQFNEGTFMCAYVKCDQYEAKGRKADV